MPLLVAASCPVCLNSAQIIRRENLAPSHIGKYINNSSSSAAVSVIGPNLGFVQTRRQHYFWRDMMSTFREVPKSNEIMGRGAIRNK